MIYLAQLLGEKLLCKHRNVKITNNLEINPFLLNVHCVRNNLPVFLILGRVNLFHTPWPFTTHINIILWPNYLLK